MSMTKEEAITYLQEKYDYIKSFYDLAAHPEEDYPETAKYLQALQIALSALRPITREQVEKARGEWRSVHGLSEYYCSRCGEEFEIHSYDKNKYRFCPFCASPMTDEAVDIVMERLEALRDEKG